MNISIEEFRARIGSFLNIKNRVKRNNNDTSGNSPKLG